MWTNPQRTTNLLTITKDILKEKLIFVLRKLSPKLSSVKLPINVKLSSVKLPRNVKLSSAKLPIKVKLSSVKVPIKVKLSSIKLPRNVEFSLWNFELEIFLNFEISTSELKFWTSLQGNQVHHYSNSYSNLFPCITFVVKSAQ